MSPEKITFIIAIILVVIFVAGAIFTKIPKRLKHEKFKDKWKHLQARCADKSQWNTALIEADDLLASALKKKKFKGKSTGERLVSAQKKFSDNDAVWFGHKLRGKIDTHPDINLSQDEVKRALVGIGQGLRDIGALR